MLRDQLLTLLEIIPIGNVAENSKVVRQMQIDAIERAKQTPAR